MPLTVVHKETVLLKYIDLIQCIMSGAFKHLAISTDFYADMISLGVDTDAVSL